MRGIVEKFGEKIVGETLEILEIYLESATETIQVIGISKALYNMAYAAPIKLLTEMRGRYVSIMDPNLSHESEEVRVLAAQIFITIFQKTYEPSYIVSTIDKSFLKKLH
jgi:hypothetical protein